MPIFVALSILAAILFFAPSAVAVASANDRNGNTFSVCTVVLLALACVPVWYSKQRRACDALFCTGQATFPMRNVLQSDFCVKNQTAGENLHKNFAIVYKIVVKTALCHLKL